MENRAPSESPPKKPSAANQDTEFDGKGMAPASKKFAQTEEFTMSTDNGDDDNGHTDPMGAPATPAANDKTHAMGSRRDTDRPHAKSSPPASTAAPISGKQKTQTMGDYQLIKKLGQGGMGAVYLAHQISLDRDCALKVMTKELASKPAFVQRFMREARVMAKLDHPNILRCFEVGEALGFHYLSMEFVEGGSIQDWLKKLGTFSIGDSLHVILACAHALQHAHELKLIHRDMKPDNVLLTKKGVIKVADLGLAKATDDDLGLTKTGTGAGTPFYMAPEQARDVKHVDGRADIYSLGCMLYEFLTKEKPFGGTTLVEVIESKEKGKFAPVRKFNQEVPERLDLMIDKMLANKPERRYQSCAELIIDLESLGLAHDRLSFIEADGPQSRTLPNPVPRKLAIKRTTPPPSSSPALTERPAPIAVSWYTSIPSDDGKSKTRKLTTQQMQVLIKSGSFNEQTQVSKTQKGGYRALGTFTEFAALFKAVQTRGQAEKKTQKFQKFYDQIDKDEKSRQRWRWFQNKFLGFGGVVGLILWLVIIAAVLGGIGYLVVTFFPDIPARIGLK